MYVIYFLCCQTVNFKDRSSDIHQTWRGNADHRSCSSCKLYLSFCRPYLRVMDLFNPNGNGLKRGWSRASTSESPCDRYEEWIDQVSIVTIYSMILGVLWNTKNVTFNSDKKFTTKNRSVDVLSCTCRQGYWMNQPLYIYIYGKWLGGPCKNPVDMCS